MLADWLRRIRRPSGTSETRCELMAKRRPSDRAIRDLLPSWRIASWLGT